MVKGPVWRQSKDMLQEEGIEVTPPQSDQSGGAAPTEADVQVTVNVHIVPLLAWFRIGGFASCFFLLHWQH